MKLRQAADGVMLCTNDVELNANRLTNLCFYCIINVKEELHINVKEELHIMFLTKCNEFGIIHIIDFKKAVSNIRYSGTHSLFDYLETCARCEELELPRGEFIATYCKEFKKLMAIVSGIAIAIGGPLMFFWDVAILFLLPGLCLLSLLPTFLSYKCLIA